MAKLDAPRIVTSRMGFDDAHALPRYLATGGYTALRTALSMPPADVAAEVDAASLLGRGGEPRRPQVVDAAQERPRLPRRER